MIDRSRVPAPVPVEVDDPREVVDEAAGRRELDERSMRLVEWVIALLAIGAAVALAIR
jgi:hypothetical protein